MNSPGANTRIEERIVETWAQRIRLRVKVGGSGPPLVYLHPAGGLIWDEFLTQLSDRYTIFAPEFPGMNPADSFSIHQLDDLFDVVLAYEEALRSLELMGAPVIGQSFGGMLAAELGSCFPSLFSKMVLLAPIGLWNAEHPWSLDFISGPPDARPNLLYLDPMAPGPKAMWTAPSDPEQALDRAVTSSWALGCAAKFLWPIPDRGLVKRLHRISAPTLIVWGAEDKVIPVAYAQEFGKRIRGSRVEVIGNCGHIPQVEQMQATLDIVSRFLMSL